MSLNQRKAKAPKLHFKCGRRTSAGACKAQSLSGMNPTLRWCGALCLGWPVWEESPGKAGTHTGRASSSLRDCAQHRDLVGAADHSRALVPRQLHGPRQPGWWGWGPRSWPPGSGHSRNREAGFPVAPPPRSNLLHQDLGGAAVPCTARVLPACPLCVPVSVQGCGQSHSKHGALLCPPEWHAQGAMDRKRQFDLCKSCRCHLLSEGLDGASVPKSVEGAEPSQLLLQLHLPACPTPASGAVGVGEEGSCAH